MITLYKRLSGTLDEASWCKMTSDFKLLNIRCNNCEES